MFISSKNDLQNAIFNSRNFSSIATDAQGIIQIFNVGAEAMLGFTREEVMNIMTPADLSDKDELKARADTLSQEFGLPIQAGFEALIYKAALGIEDIYELTYICKDGRRLPAQVSVTALRDEQHDIIGYLLIGTDNTAKALLKAKLKIASALQEAIFNSHNFSSIATDAEGVIQIFNVGAENMLGYTAAEVVNIMTPADLSDKDELASRTYDLNLEFNFNIHSGFEALVYKAALGIEDIYELTYICKDGRRFPAQVSVTALRDEQQIIIGYLLIATVNTARKLAEKNSRIASAAFESEHSMYVTTPDCFFVHANQAFSNISGYDNTELMGKKVSILKSGNHDAEFYKAMWTTLIDTGHWSGEIWNKRKNGEKHLELVNIIAIKDSHGCTSHYVATGSDISKLKAYEVGLIDAKEKAERFSTLKSQFIASMSHEIRTPMTAIIGFSTLALYEDMPEEVRLYLQDINTASTSLLGILQDVLDFTKLEAGRVRIEVIPFNVLDLLDTIGTLFTGSAQQKGLTFIIKRDSATPLELIGDKLRLQQVLTNLVGNAIKFTAQGNVKLELTLQSINLSQVQLLFTVTDTGIGIALEDQDKLFVEFSQVDGSFTREYGGTGLGLVISKELVELMGGEICLVSVKNEGSSFSFALQFDINKVSTSHTNEDKVIRQEAPSPPSPIKHKGCRILVVEDNAFSQKIIQRYLLTLGLDSMMAQHGEEALSLLEQYDFDVVLMDIHMPVMNGIETTLLIRKQAKYASLPIIALSAGVTELERNNCKACGMVDFIPKPIDLKQFSAALEQWLKPRSLG